MISAVKVNVICPQCSVEKILDFPSNLSALSKSGILRVQIPEGAVCPHSFVLFIDMNFKIRGYEHYDFELKGYETLNFSDLFDILKSANPAIKQKIINRL